MGDRSLIPEDDVRQAVAGTGWEVSDGRLVLTVEKADFAEALAFVNRVGEVAEARNHHPDVTISWNTVTLTQWSHSAGGITEADIDLAKQIAEL